MAMGICRTGGAAVLAATALVAGAGGAPAGASEAAPTAPAIFVGLTDPDTGPSAVGVFSSATGELLRRLTPEAPGRRPERPARSRPAARAVVYAAGAGSCASEIARVALDGRSAPEVLVSGAGRPGAAARARARRPPARVRPGVLRQRRRPSWSCSGTAPTPRRWCCCAPAAPRASHRPRWSADGWLAFRTTGEGSRPARGPAARAGARVRSRRRARGLHLVRRRLVHRRAGPRSGCSPRRTAPTAAAGSCSARGCAPCGRSATFPGQRGAQAVSVDASGHARSSTRRTAPACRARSGAGASCSGERARSRSPSGPSAPSWR